jgi:hypothetical protein
LRELVVSLKADYVLIDGIEAGVSGYPFHHGRSDFAKLGKIAAEIRSLDGVRTLYLISVAGPCEMAPLNGGS